MGVRAAKFLLAVALLGCTPGLGCAPGVVATASPSSSGLGVIRPGAIPEAAEPSDLERHDPWQVALDHHLELWRCVEQVAPIMHEDLWIAFDLVDADGDGRAAIELASIPDRPILRACLRRALASTEFTIDAPLRDRYRLRFEPDVVAAKLASLAEDGEHERPPTVDACPLVDPRCVSVSLTVALRSALFVPEHGLADASTPAAPPITVEFCVDPVEGKTRRIRPSRAWLGDASTTRVVERVALWRFAPIEIDGAPILACTHVEFDLDQASASGERVPEGALQPRRVVAAQPVYTPRPNLSPLARPTFGGRRRPLSGWNVTHFCVDERGKVSSTVTRQRYPHNRLVDALLRETIRRWRFKPLIVDGKPRASCMDQRFRIVLE